MLIFIQSCTMYVFPPGLFTGLTPDSAYHISVRTKIPDEHPPSVSFHTLTAGKGLSQNTPRDSNESGLAMVISVIGTLG